MDIQYQIEFFSNWHCGSGLAAGADVDALVVKDANGLPYVPGRTLKGLLREAAYELNQYAREDHSSFLDDIFGISGDQPITESNAARTGSAFFGNATLAEGKAIVTNRLVSYLFQTFASTAIDENSGIAKDNSLRKTETVVPCILKGDIRNVPEQGVTLLEKAMQMVKRMGTGRNRGYGRCCISIITKEESK